MRPEPLIERLDGTSAAPPPRGHADGTSEGKPHPEGRALVIGNLDGVHRGHQAIIKAAVAVARVRSLEPALLTFDPHPGAVVGSSPPPVLTTLERKAELARRLGIERVFARTFDAAFAAWSPERFVRDLLVSQVAAKAVFVGDNFRFGSGRAGDLAELQRLGADAGFDAYGFGMLRDDRGPLSSSRARADIASGELEDARLTLGRWHAIVGRVAPGDQRGRTLGFPTANLADVAEILPPHGVYAVAVDEVQDDGARALATGVMNVGVRPTLGRPPALSIEVHLFDLARDLYGLRLRVHLVARLRDERKFDGLEALKAQIAEDARVARTALADVAPLPEGSFG
jgi:riboflavin kinase/FMN adenylyltransferase